MCLRKIFVLMTLLLLISVPGYSVGNSVYKVSPQIPLDSWTYPALERVVALCGVKSSLAGTRPLTRLEAARLIGEQPDNVGPYNLPPQANELLNRLKDEFREELAYLADLTGVQVPVPEKMLRSAEINYTYRDGRKAAYTGTAASQFPLNYNNFGREYDNYNNGSFSLLGDVRLFDSLLLSWQPEVSLLDDDGVEFDIISAVAALSISGVEFSVGRQALWWGPGRHGSLLLTNNAESLDMLRITNPSPLQLPWFLKYLGPFRFDLFVSRLDNDRVVDKPYFGGMRVDFRPASWLELGASRTVMFGGDGRPSVDASDFLTIIGGNNLTDNEDTSNSVAGIDARLIIHPLWGAQIYGELAGEDEAGGFFSKNSYLVGAYLPQIDPYGIFSFRTEYADTTRLGGGAPVFYRHSIYKSGYIYKDQIMGHHVGSDATDLFFELQADFSDSVSVTLGYDYEERGKELALQEEHSQFDIKGTWWLSHDLSVSARYAYDSVENWNFAKGDQDFYLVNIGVEYSF